MATNTRWADRVKSEVLTKEPANRLYVFAKTCTNDHGTFTKGDKARGSFSDELVNSYLEAGILTHASDRTSGAAQDAPIPADAD